jgi:hypothetical protein
MDRNCEITLWCIGEKCKKRNNEDLEDVPPSKRTLKEDRVDEIAKELYEKHGERYVGSHEAKWSTQQHGTPPSNPAIWWNYGQA